MSRNGAAIMDVLYVVERDTAAFEAARTTVDIVCAGDSLTGWNNFGPVRAVAVSDVPGLPPGALRPAWAAGRQRRHCW